MSDADLGPLDIVHDREGIVISRPNRFLMIADVLMDDGSILKDQKVHVHDPGRLKEIIFPGNRVRLRKARTENRKTRWDLIYGLVDERWVLVNSSFHRRIATALLEDVDASPFGSLKKIEAEVKIGSSRLDFRVTMEEGEICYIETKGCTLAVDEEAIFPDAPTTRGTRHLRELMEIKKSGTRAAVIFLVLAPGVNSFSPNRETDPDFADTLSEAHSAGVEIYPVYIDIVNGSPVFNGLLPLKLEDH